VWKTPEPCTDSNQAIVSNQIAQAFLKDPALLPNLRYDDHLVLAADYSGDHQSSEYQILTFLLADRPGVLKSWDIVRREIRRDFLSDGRRHAFKKLRDAQRQKALGPFLRASAEINGVVFCVVIDKNLANSTFGYEFPDVTDVRPAVLAKLIRVAFFGSVLTAGMARPGQTLKWLTDNDEIVGNAKVQQVAGLVISSLFRRLCPFEFRDASIGIAGDFDDDYRAEDLCSIPDLVGGAMSDMINAMPKYAIPKTAGLYTPVLTHQSTKATILAAWFACLNGPLKKLLCLIRPDTNDGFYVSLGTPEVDFCDMHSSHLWLPPDPGWKWNWRTESRPSG